MEWVNITAKTLPEAIDLALDNLGVDEAEAEIEVLEEPRQGLFGRTRGNARVRARVKPRATRPKVERGRQRRRRGEAGESKSGGARKGRSRRDDESDGRNGGPEDTASEAVAAPGEGEAAEVGSTPVKKRSAGGQDRSSKQQRKTEAPVEEASMDEVRNHLEVFLGGLTEAFGFDDGVTVVDDGDGGLVAQVNGRHGLMVGPKARTLDAIQELARVSSQRTAPSSIRIKVDVGGYREMRAEALRKFALEAAEAALADGRERSLEPMNSADRKIVHDALSGMVGMETRSVGDEPRRRVVLVPSVTGDANRHDDVADDDLNAGNPADPSEELDGQDDLGDFEAVDEVVDDDDIRAGGGAGDVEVDAGDGGADADGAPDAETISD